MRHLNSSLSSTCLAQNLCSPTQYSMSSSFLSHPPHHTLSQALTWALPITQCSLLLLSHKGSAFCWPAWFSLLSGFVLGQKPSGCCPNLHVAPSSLSALAFILSVKWSSDCFFLPSSAEYPKGQRGEKWWYCTPNYVIYRPLLGHIKVH